MTFSELALYNSIAVFCCFAGLSHANVEKLAHADIDTDDDGERWIIDLRAKTDTQFRVKLLPIAKMRHEKYSRLAVPGGRVFPVKTYKVIVMSLRHVAHHAGLSFNCMIRDISIRLE